MVGADPKSWTLARASLACAWSAMPSGMATRFRVIALFGVLPHPALQALHAVLTGVDPSTVAVVDAARATLRQLGGAQ